MEREGGERVREVVESSLSRINWRLKPSSKRRLLLDVVALCTNMRAVVMVDYGGKMPQLQERLCSLLNLCHQESPIFEHLRVMVIEDMIYLVHVRGLSEYVNSSLNSEVELVFVNLEQDPPKMVTEAEKCPLGIELKNVQQRFSSIFTPSGVNLGALPSPSSQYFDLSICLQDSEITIPTLNGWLLGYPVVYLFGKNHISDAIYNLSTKFLRLYKISVCRNDSTNKNSQPEELLSFSVPYELSMGGSSEKWAEEFLARMRAKWERCKQCWRSLEMEVGECHPQAIVL